MTGEQKKHCPQPDADNERLRRELADANKMLHELQEELAETNRGLLALSMELEDRVARRTSELQEANKKLRLALEEQEEIRREIEILATFPEQNPNPVIRVSIPGDILFVNQAGWPLLEAWRCPPESKAPVELSELINDVYMKGEVHSREVECPEAVYLSSFAPIVGEGYVNIYAIDISKRKLMESALQQELEVNAALAGLGREMITGSGSTASMAQSVLEHAKGLTGSEHGLVSSIDPDTGENVCHTFTAMMGKGCQVEEEGRRISFPPGKDGKYPALWGHCLNTHTSFFTNAPAGHAQAKGLPPGHIPLKQFLSVPVLFGQELVGQIALANSDRDYNEHDVQVMERLARLYALVIQRERGEEKRRQLEKNLWQAQKMEAAGTLAGGIAHDFNNILAAMIGYVNLALYEMEPGSQNRQNLEQVLKASRRAKNLIQQIVAFSRRSEQEVQPLNICPIVKEALKLLRATLPASIEVKQDIPLEIHSVLAEPGQIHQIVMNLCTNAAHTMREKGGVLKVELSNEIMNKEQLFLKPELRPGPYIKLSVSDTGQGIDPAIIDRIFEPYFTTKEAHEGTGLGLSVVHGIAKSFGGEVTVYSELGSGTIFNVYLPAIAAQPYQKTEETPLVQGRGERVLFVDDEAMLVDVAGQTLRRLGYEVEAFAGAWQALEAFKDDPSGFDLVITDFNMPKMNGVQLATEMRNIRSDIPIIVCSGFSERINEDNVADFGIDAFLMKPLYDFELAEAIRKVLEKAVKNA